MDRITLLASLSKDANSLVDVGCDHGYVAIKALNEYNVKKAYLLDINDGPLENASKNIKDAGLEDRTKVLKSDGLKSFEEEGDTLVIAGMGGILISEILGDSISKAKKFKRIILEPNNEDDKLRGFLINNHFVFDNEDFIRDGKKHYVVITGHFDDEAFLGYSHMDMKYGPILRRKMSPLYKDFLFKKKEILKEALSKVTDEYQKAKLKIELASLNLVLEEKDGKKKSRIKKH